MSISLLACLVLILDRERLDLLRTLEVPVFTGQETYDEATKQTRRLETQLRHARERYDKALEAVQDLEVRLDITTRWTPGTEAWQKACAMVAKREYQRALDKLQALVISRMFELSKMNMAGTGKPPIVIEIEN